MNAAIIHGRSRILLRPNSRLLWRTLLVRHRHVPLYPYRQLEALFQGRFRVTNGK